MLIRNLSLPSAHSLSPPSTSSPHPRNSQLPCEQRAITHVHLTCNNSKVFSTLKKCYFVIHLAFTQRQDMFRSKEGLDTQVKNSTLAPVLFCIFMIECDTLKYGDDCHEEKFCSLKQTKKKANFEYFLIEKLAFYL